MKDLLLYKQRLLMKNKKKKLSLLSAIIIHFYKSYREKKQTRLLGTTK